MELADIIREKRRELGLTQEQVAIYLGITTPAVNKWEKGLTCPDLTLIPTLARLLKTDPNTLLCFKENLTEQEVGLFINEITLKTQEESYACGFALGMEKVKEYPRCAHLRYAVALVLEGLLLRANLGGSEGKDYLAQLTQLYRQVAQCDDVSLANEAQYMLASKLMAQGEYQGAQELIDGMPREARQDKKTLQATLFSKVGKGEDAAALLEEIAISSLGKTLMAVTKLIPLLVAQGNMEQAKQLAKAATIECEAFGLWEYNAQLAQMELAVASRNVEESIGMIKAMLSAVKTPWDVSACPLYCHQKRKEQPKECAGEFLSAMLSELESCQEYEFLQKEPEFKRIIAEYKQEN
ncbi:MAG: helix-turn-helix transcriptional regulator [Oscillospiraceae bacterium]